MRGGVASYIGAGVHVAIGRNLGLLSGSERLYLDHAATTPVLPEARAAIARALESWANPSSPHAEGRAARFLLEEARSTIARMLEWRHDVILTSGASESVEIAAKRALVEGRVHGATEHAIVPHAMGPNSRVIAVTPDGLIDEASLDAVLAEGPALVAIQHVNNETGVIQPLDRLAEKIRSAGSLLLADCAQSAGKLPLPDADFIAACAHKLGGPPGVGVLLVRDLATLEAVGGQEKGYRRGTQDMPAALGFAAALAAKPYDMERLLALRSRLDAAIQAGGGCVIAKDAPRIPTIGSIAMPGGKSESLLVQLDLAGIAVSAGSACSSGKMQSSKVLAAMHVPEDMAASFIRVSFGPNTSEADIDRFVTEWQRIGNRSKAEAA
ncbi:cysteine desulfurase family protein [Sphingomonas limnosediminicola]|uniref:Cysteine desulfurase n=1 Tax=Sphingomonas limnosediminicola TaxID=940133 RepID=A0ABP7KVW9_9SPHN